MKIKSGSIHQFQDDTADLQIVAPLSPAEASAAMEADAVRVEIDGRLKRQRSRPCGKHPSCGKTMGSFHQPGNQAASVHGPLRCGRTDCPYCRRRTICRLLGKSAGVLLTVSPRSNRPRVAKLFAGVCTWQAWGAVSKAIRRADAGCGHLRIRYAGGKLLVISERPFRGSFAVSPADAVRLAADAVESLDPIKHAFRLLGAWREEKDRPEWVCVRHRRESAEVYRVALEIGAKLSDVRGKLGKRFRCVFGPEVPTETVSTFWVWLGDRNAPRPSLALKGNNPSRDKAGQRRAGGAVTPGWDWLDTGPEGEAIPLAA